MNLQIPKSPDFWRIFSNKIAALNDVFLQIFFFKKKELYEKIATKKIFLFSISESW